MQKKYIALVIAVLASLGGMYVKYQHTSSKPPYTGPTLFAKEPVIENYHVTEAAKPLLFADAEVGGGVVSHHLYVAPIMAQYFKALKSVETKPKVVVIIGPDHFNAASTAFTTSYLPYQTPFGLLDTNTDIINALADSKKVMVQDSPFKYEHSITALVGYVKWAFPDATVVPIIMKRSVNAAKVQEVTSLLETVLPKDSFVLASVDFSHHQDRWAAAFHDEYTIAALKNGDALRLGRAEVDCPGCLSVLSHLMQQRGYNKVIGESTSSAVFSKQLASMDVTSYYFGLFSKGKSPDGGVVTLLNFGDAFFGRNVAKRIAVGGNPFEYIVGVEGNFFRGQDVIMLNLEGPIVERERCVPKNALHFRFDVGVAELMRKVGVNAVTIANNHIDDCGVSGKERTLQLLQENGFKVAGVDSVKPFVIDGEGNRVKVIGINALSLTEVGLAQLVEDIKEQKKDGSLIWVNAHWGVEYEAKPEAFQVQIAHSLIDAGASVIIGHHPHVVGPLELYKQGVIFYSLGNFVFDQEYKLSTEGLGVGGVVSKDKIKFYVFPLQIKNTQPQLLPYVERELRCNALLERIPTIDSCVFEIKR